MYEDKIRRRDEHRRKKKQEWNNTYNKLKEENEYLRDCASNASEANHTITADRILESMNLGQFNFKY